VKILSIDPGMTVGVAILSDGNLINAWDFSATHPLSFYKWVYSEVVEGDYDMIVVEDYVGAGSMSKVAGHTIRQIGFIEGLCLLEEQPFVRQSPSTRTPFIKRAEDLGVKNHAKHALAHALAYERKHHD